MLTTARVRAAAPQARPYKIADGQGLFLFVAPTGLRSWRMAFRFGGKAQLITFGQFPSVSLSDARCARDEARARLRQGVRPTGVRTREAVANAALTFEAVALAWHADQARTWSPAHAADTLASLQRDILPHLGATLVCDVTSPTLLKLLRNVERRGSLETARRLFHRLNMIFERATAEGLIEHNPAAPVRSGLARRRPTKWQPAVTALEDVREAYAAIAAVLAASSARAAVQLLALTAVRSAAVRLARWDEFEGIDWQTGQAIEPLWRVPSINMKLAWTKKGDARFDHLVPLSSAAVQVLRAARAGGVGEYVFPGRNGQGPLSENTLSELHARAGLRGRHTPHGWRASFATILNEARPGDRAAIDLALAHAPKDKVEAAYNRSEQLGRRRVLFELWAEMLMP